MNEIARPKRSESVTIDGARSNDGIVDVVVDVVAAAGFFLTFIIRRIRLERIVRKAAKPAYLRPRVVVVASASAS